MMTMTWSLSSGASVIEKKYTYKAGKIVRKSSLDPKASVIYIISVEFRGNQFNEASLDLVEEALPCAKRGSSYCLT